MTCEHVGKWYFSLDVDLDKFCESWFAINTAAAGIDLFVASWNEHPIPGM